MFQEKEPEYKRDSRQPRAHQLMIGRASVQSSSYDQSDTSLSSSNDSFCLQMKIKSTQAETTMQALQCLVTNIEYKLKPHRRRTTFLRARIDICSTVFVMPVSVYHLIYNDPDYAKLAPSNKDGIFTYTTEKIKAIGSCELLVVHPNTKCFKEVTFQVVNHEGSVIVSCTTSIDLNLIQSQSKLNSQVPDYGRLIYSCADDPGKHKYRKMKSNVTRSDNASEREVQSLVEPKVSKTDVTQWKNQDIQEENKQQQAQTKDNTECSDNKCQETTIVHMWPQKPSSCNMWSKEPAIKYKKSNQVKLNQTSMEDDKECQINRRPLKSKMYEDKNCQDIMCEYDDSKSQSTMK